MKKIRAFEIFFITTVVIGCLLAPGWIEQKTSSPKPTRASSAFSPIPVTSKLLLSLSDLTPSSPHRLWGSWSTDASNTQIMKFLPNGQVEVVSGHRKRIGTYVQGAQRGRLFEIDFNYGNDDIKTIYEFEQNGDLRIAFSTTAMERPTKFDKMSGYLSRLP